MAIISTVINSLELRQSTLTNWIKTIPIEYNLVSQLNIFNPVPIATTLVSVEPDETKARLVMAVPRGMNNYYPDGIKSNKNAVYFEVPHLPIRDPIVPSDIQNTRVGGDNVLISLREVVQERLEKHKINLMSTIEYLKIGALRGQILNSDGTLLFDLFEKFNKNQTTVDFQFSGLAEMQTKCNQVKRSIELALGMDTIRGFACFASDAFFDEFTTQDSVKEAYAGYGLAEQRLGGETRNGFSFGGITFYNYNPTIKNPSGGVVRFVPEGEAMFFPLGTRNTFQYIIAPANTMDTVNTRGVEFTSFSWVSEDRQSLGIHSESNVLPLCTNPGVLVRGIGA